MDQFRLLIVRRALDDDRSELGALAERGLEVDIGDGIRRIES